MSIVGTAAARTWELLRTKLQMPTTAIAPRIAWDRSIRVLAGRAAELLPAHLLPDPANRTASVCYFCFQVRLSAIRAFTAFFAYFVSDLDRPFCHH